MKQKKKGRFWKGLGLMCLVTTGAGVLWGTYTPQGQEITEQVKHAASVGGTVYQNPGYIFDQVGGNHVNILLIGEDRNWVVGKVFNPQTGKYASFPVVDEKTPPRSDTMIILSLDRAANTMRMLSLPRDARVRFRDLEGTSYKGKLNSVYASGGSDPMARREVLKKFLADEMGIRIDRVAVIRIEGFIKLVDKIGGVDVNVDGALKRDRAGKLYRGRMQSEDIWGKWKVDLEPGPQHLNGDQAQGYVRFRKDIEGDPGRIRRQQQVMRALAKGMMSQPLWRLPDTAKELRQQFKADMDDTEMASVAYFTRNLGSTVKIQPMTPYGVYESNGDIRLNKPQNEKLFKAIFGSSFTSENFLVRSPWTERDDIGHTNNRNPSALSVLREAGLVDKDKDTSQESNPVLDAPVRPSQSEKPDEGPVRE
ncbi:MAG TPA: LCP family protein [Abditibacterium sp.]